MIADNKSMIFWQIFGARPKKVLELGPWDGRDTIVMGQFCQSIVCIEARTENILATKKAVDELPYWPGCGLSFIQENLETIDLTGASHYDLVLASGVLYHLPKPWELIAKIVSVTDWVLGWTHLAERDDAMVEGREGYWWKDNPSDPLGGLSPESFWMTPESFTREWERHHFEFNFLTRPEPHFNGGLAAQFSASRIKVGV